jgi:hypothetical protein
VASVQKSCFDISLAHGALGLEFGSELYKEYKSKGMHHPQVAVFIEKKLL